MATITLDPNAPEFTRRYPNLADPRLGATTMACSDDFFAGMARMLNPEPAVFIPGKYDTNGKWMDGWESRRKRVNGYDWCTLKLARPGAFTHLRLNIYPDGGVARLRAYAQPENDWAAADRTSLYDLIAMENGGYVVATNNQHFGLASNLLMPGRGVNMGDGWETRRRREPGNDWCIIALAHPGIVEKIEVDTCHFKGNFPDSCSIQAASMAGGTDTSLITQSMFWPVLLPQQKLQMDYQHEIQSLGAITHIRVNIFPDGGVSRLRLHSRLV